MNKFEQKRLYDKIMGPFKNISARARGYGGCGACGDTWNWKEEHVIPFEKKGKMESGVFPVCEECWQRASDSDILQATDKLAKLWVAQSSFQNAKQAYKHATKMVSAVKKALRNRGKENE